MVMELSIMSVSLFFISYAKSQIYLEQSGPLTAQKKETPYSDKKLDRKYVFTL